MPTQSKEAILLSYRRLYRHALQAVQYAAPARYTLRHRLQSIYRTGVAADYDEQRIENTIEFLRGAAQEQGLEHQIVKRLVHVWWWEAENNKQVKNLGKTSTTERHLRDTALEQFKFTLQMLNDSMGLCLR